MSVFSRLSSYAAFLCLVSLPAHAQETSRSADHAALSPGELIESLGSGDRAQAFWGDLVVFDGGQLSAFEVSRDGALNALDSGGADAVEPPGSAAGLLLEFPVRALLNAAAVYGLSACPERWVSGRRAVCVEVKPADVHRHGYMLWMDPAVPAVLAVAVHTAEGALLESARFVRAQPGRMRRAAMSASPTPGMPPELPRWLPPGFSLQSVGVSGSETMMRFSDGVAAFTLYITPVDDRLSESGTTLRGASVVVDRIAKHQGKPARLVTLAGEIPLATARRILVGTNAGTGP